MIAAWMSVDIVNAAAAVAAAGVPVVIHLSRRPGVNSMPPGAPRAATYQTVVGAPALAELPPDMEERLFIAEETPDIVDDIAAREAAIAFFEERIDQAKSPQERMPFRRAIRELRYEIDELSGRHRGGPSVLARIFDPVWAVFYKLRPLRRRTRPWLAALLGFVFGGIGLIVYFRAWVDLGVIVALVISMFALDIAVGGAAWWIGAAVASIYGFIRSESSNRQLALALPEATPAPSGGILPQNAE